jgi:hypothetical protein
MTAGRSFAVLITSALLVVLSADAQQPAPIRHTATFTAPDGAFRFSYRNDFKVCTKGRIQPCLQSYIPVCEQDALACAIFPAEEFKNTNFSAASFQVREIVTLPQQQTMSANNCVTPFYPQKDGVTAIQWPEFVISAEHPMEMIGGIQFVHGLKGGAAMSNDIASDLYRAFYGQRCWELSVSQTGTNPMTLTPPMKTLTPAQQKELDRVMSDMLHSFRFTR